MLENCCSAQFLKGGHNLLLQNVTVHVGIHVSLNKPQLPSTSSTHAAPDHDATTTMVDCRQGTIFTRIQLLCLTLARLVPSETRLGKPLYDPRHCTVTRFQAVTELLIASAIFVESNNSNFQILREFFCHEVPCWTSSGQYERIVLKAPNLNCSKTRYTNLYGPVKQTKTWWIGHVALYG